MPAECVEVASSWSLQEAGFWGFEKRESERGIHPFVRASIHIPDQTADQERERAGGGGGVGMEEKEKDHMSMLEK